jgi:hypothetical protein
VPLKHEPKLESASDPLGVSRVSGSMGLLASYAANQFVIEPELTRSASQQLARSISALASVSAAMTSADLKWPDSLKR